MIGLSVVALSVSLTHTFIDLFIGLYGSGSTMNLLQAGLIAALATLHGWWAAAIARAASGRGAELTLALFAGVWLLGGNGVGGLVSCPPSCPNAWPYQDVAHVASVIVGALAIHLAWRARRQAALSAVQTE